MRTLDATLLAAQDATSRKPRVEIKLGQFAADLPFGGNDMGAAEYGPQGPALLLHSSGRLVSVYTDDHGTEIAQNRVILATTDANRTTWDIRTLFARDSAIGDATFYDFSLAEDDDGGILLAFCRTNTTGGYRVEVTKFSLPAFGSDPEAITRTVALASQALPVSGATIEKAGSSYILAYCADSAVSVGAAGTYTGTADAVFYIEITTAGTYSSAKFRWKKDNGAWVENVNTSSVVALTEGVSAAFVGSSFWPGQTFQFDATAARKAFGTAELVAQAHHGDTITVGSKTYTFRSLLSEETTDPENPGSFLPAVANEVRIDSLSTEITAQNLLCAINGSTYEGTGAGVRYGTGTTANTIAEADARSGARVSLKAITPGANGNYITLSTVSGGRISIVAFSTGSDAYFGGVSGTPSSKIQIKTATAITGAWSAATEPTIGNISSARRKLDTYIFDRGGELWLWFAYLTSGASIGTAVYNIVYTISTDGGSTWGDAVTVSGFDTPSRVGRRPGAVSRTADTILFYYDSVRTILFADNGTTGWNTSEVFIRHVQLDEASRKALVVVGHVGAGNRAIDAILRFDLDTWQIDRAYTPNSVPAIPPEFTASFGDIEQVDWYGGSGRILAFSNTMGLSCVIDDEAYTVRVLCWRNDVPTRTANVDGIYIPDSTTNLYLKSIEIDPVNRTLCLAFIKDLSVIRGWTLYVGSVPFDGEGTVSWTTQIEYPGIAYEHIWSYADMIWDFDTSSLILNCHGDSTTSYDIAGWLRVFSLVNGGELEFYSTAESGNFPYYGLAKIAVDSGKIYGTLWLYTTAAGQANNYGIVEIDRESGVITWLMPPYFTNEAPKNNQIIVGAGFLACGFSNYGIVIYNLSTHEWGSLNSETVPGFSSMDSWNYVGRIAIDSTTNSILFGPSDVVSSVRGLFLVPIAGKIERMTAAIGSIAAGVVTFGTEFPLVRGMSDSNGGAVYVSETGAIWAAWTRTNSTGSKVKWDSEAGELDVSAFIAAGQEISERRSIDGTAHTLRFTLSNGHLFDRTNALSTMARYVKHGKKASLRFGEEIGGTTYWQPGAEIFAIVGAALSYERGKYPSITIEAQDRRAWQENNEVVASQYFSDTAPESVIGNILENHGGLLAADISLPSFGATSNVYQQYLSRDVLEICNSICERYGWFLDINTAGQITARQINLDAAASRTLTDFSRIIKWTPDDRYASQINRVIVTGEGRGEIEVVMAEESVLSDAGTLGFFCSNITKRHYYSEDKTRRCRSPRLEITQDVANIGFQMGGKMRLAITATDPNDTWVEVTASGPNLLPLFLAGIGMIVAGKSMPPTTTSTVVVAGIGGGTGTGWLHNPGESKFAATLKDIGLILCLEVLGAIGNYGYTVWANPVGTVRQTFQGQADDEDLQAEMGGVVLTKRITEPLAYTAAQCREVAEFELSLIRAQRNRVKFEKPAHLADEPGDVLEIPHPYTGVPGRVFLSDITRKMIIPSGNGGGTFTDECEGWRL